MLHRRGAQSNGWFGVSLNGKLLYEARDETRAAGRIGIYGRQGLVRVKDIRVAGTSKPATGDFVVPPPNFVYDCDEEGDGSSIRAKRFRITATGLEWVPPRK